MSLVEALILGLVQGLTEFLPVSSSGHLVLAERLLGVTFNDITFEVAIHFATLLAVLIFFFRPLIKIFFSPFKMLSGKRSDNTVVNFRILIAICIGTIPAVIIGLSFKDRIESAFSSVTMVSILLLATSAILLSSRFAKPKGSAIGAGNGFLIGCAQALAILPGISRSGSTITASLFCGVSREESFNFSFMLSVPAILGASALTALDMFEAEAFQGGISYLVGMVAAFVSGYFSLVILKRIVTSGRFHYFGFYTLIIGLIGIIFLG